MIHYTCDRCQKKIDNATELRYQVSVVTQVVLDQPEDFDEQRDNLDELNELLMRVDDEECEQLCSELYQSRRFDLCSFCFSQYSENPLGAEPQLQVEFSEN